MVIEPTQAVSHFSPMINALGSLLDILANMGGANGLFGRRGKGVEMVSLSQMSLERPPVYNPRFMPVRKSRLASL